MRRIVLSVALFLAGYASLLGTEVEVSSSPKPTGAESPKQLTSPQQEQVSSSPSPTAGQELPRYRPALLGTGPNAGLINRINSQELLRQGQKDGSIMFCCSVTRAGEVAHAWTYRGTPATGLLEKEMLKQLDQTIFVPAVYNHEVVPVLFYGTVTFAVVNGKPRLRIFSNQETEEIKKETDFIGPQPFVGHDSKFEGLHYPDDVLRAPVSGLVDLAMKIDGDGNLQDLNVVSEEPPLIGFRRAAAEDFRVAKFIPAFRNGKPTECSITLPVYYEP